MLMYVDGILILITNNSNYDSYLPWLYLLQSEEHAFKSKNQ